MSAHGRSGGEICGRNGCQGVIEEDDSDGCCSCHINPPCSYCEKPKEVCLECGWSANEERESEDRAQWKAKPTKALEQKEEDRRHWELVRIKHMAKSFDPSRINSKVKSHTNSSQIVEGWFPAHMTKEDVRKHANGTFGGRFESFSRERQTFRFIAYTD